MYDFYCLRAQNISWMFSIIINGKYLNSLKFYQINDCIVKRVLYEFIAEPKKKKWKIILITGIYEIKSCRLCVKMKYTFCFRFLIDIHKNWGFRTILYFILLTVKPVYNWRIVAAKSVR
jgi:hypothetical protein